MKRLPFVIADRHAVMRTGIRTLLEERPDWKVVAEADDGHDAIAKAKACNPALVVIDINLPVLNGIEATRRIAAECPFTHILIFTSKQSELAAHEAVRAGARGYVLKTDRAYDLIVACDLLLRNEIYITRPVARLVLDEYLGLNPQRSEEVTFGLTARERQVIQLLAEGYSAKEVAVFLGIEVKTAEVHRTNLMRKLNCHSIVELVRFAVRNLHLDLDIPRRE